MLSIFNLCREDMTNLMLKCSIFRNFELQKPLLGAYGTLLNKNTLETFKNCKKNTLLEELGQELWHSITSGEALNNPALLSRFFLLTYAVNLIFIPIVTMSVGWLRCAYFNGYIALSFIFRI
jgi:hypothetical protein